MKCRVSAIALAVTAVISATPAFPANNGLISQAFPRDSVVVGRAYGDWSAAWWQWVLSIPATSSPLFDNTVDCKTGQSGPVFFLAGNGGGSSERNCTVPSGKALFFPVLNQISTSFPAPLTLINEMRAANASAMDSATGMLVDLDGRQLNDIPDFRVTSVTFDVTLPDNNLFGIPSGEYGTAADDGYYVMLKPLSAGSHTLHFKGSSSAISLDVVYHLTQQ